MQTDLEEWILSRGDTPANHSHSPGSETARKMTAISGQRCATLSKHSGPLGSLVKTLLVTYPWDSTRCFLTWKHSATPASRLLFRLVPSMPRTGETESGLWQTPVSDDAVEREQGKFNSRGEPKLSAQAKLWPTPTSRDHKDTGDCANVPVNGLLGRSVGPSKGNGSLNPLWVEWLQGYPVGWTDLEPSETP